MPVRPLRAASRRGPGSPHPGVVDRSPGEYVYAVSRYDLVVARDHRLADVLVAIRDVAQRAARAPSRGAAVDRRPRDTPGRPRCCTPTRPPTRATGGWSRRRSPPTAWPSSVPDRTDLRRAVRRDGRRSAADRPRRGVLGADPDTHHRRPTLRRPRRALPGLQALGRRRGRGHRAPTRRRRVASVDAAGRRAAAVLRRRARGSPRGSHATTCSPGYSRPDSPPRTTSTGEPLSMEEMISIVQQLQVAGSETTASLISDMVLALSHDPSTWQQLAIEPERAAARRRGGAAPGQPEPGIVPDHHRRHRARRGEDSEGLHGVGDVRLGQP